MRGKVGPLVWVAVAVTVIELFGAVGVTDVMFSQQNANPLRDARYGFRGRSTLPYFTSFSDSSWINPTPGA